MTFEYDPNSDSLVNMLNEQWMLQRDSFGIRIDRFTEKERVDFIKSMVLAMQAELIEALDETSWKPWDTREPIVDDNAFLGELVDVWHFLMNLFLVAMPRYDSSAIASIVHSRYAKKNKINRDRHADNTYVNDNKCPRCKRALDDAAVTCTRSVIPNRTEMRRGEPGTPRFYCGKDAVFVSSAGVEI